MSISSSFSVETGSCVLNSDRGLGEGVEAESAFIINLELSESSKAVGRGDSMGGGRMGVTKRDSSQ